MQQLNKEQALVLVEQMATQLDAAALQNPFSSQVWTAHFIRHIATQDWVIVALQSTAPALLTLLYHERGKAHTLRALSNYYASLYSPILSAEVDRQGLATRMVRQLDVHRPRIATVNLAPLAENSPDTAALQLAFKECGWYTRAYHCFGNWYLPCENLSFSDYMAGRDSRTRNTWKRKSRKFANPGDPDGARLEIVTTPERVDAAMDAYERVYLKSWKKPEPYPDFVRGWARHCAKNGSLRLGLAWLGETPIAAQLWFTEHRRAYIYKLAYDEAYKKWSAGTVLSARLFEHSLDTDKVIEIDYLTGDDPYKKAWMSHRRERIGLLACNQKSLRGVLVSLKERAGALTSRWRHRQAG